MIKKNIPNQHACWSEYGAYGQNREFGKKWSLVSVAAEEGRNGADNYVFGDAKVVTQGLDHESEGGGLFITWQWKG